MKNFTKTNNEEFEKYGFLVVRDFYDISSFIQEPPKSERGQLLHRQADLLKDLMMIKFQIHIQFITIHKNDLTIRRLD